MASIFSKDVKNLNNSGLGVVNAVMQGIPGMRPVPQGYELSNTKYGPQTFVYDTSAPNDVLCEQHVLKITATGYGQGNVRVSDLVQRLSTLRTETGRTYDIDGPALVDLAAGFADLCVTPFGLVNRKNLVRDDQISFAAGSTAAAPDTKTFVMSITLLQSHAAGTTRHTLMVNGIPGNAYGGVNFIGTPTFMYSATPWMTSVDISAAYNMPNAKRYAQASWSPSRVDAATSGAAPITQLIGRVGRLGGITAEPLVLAGYTTFAINNTVEAGKRGIFGTTESGTGSDPSEFEVLTILGGLNSQITKPSGPFDLTVATYQSGLYM